MIEHWRQRGHVVILSDGDAVFQPRKVECSEIFEAVEGNVLIYIHKFKATFIGLLAYFAEFIKSAGVKNQTSGGIDRTILDGQRPSDHGR